jgi:exodeoxyribonuclease V alpha subunit
LQTRERGSTSFRHDAGHPLPLDLVVIDEASMIDLPLMCKLFEAVPAAATVILIGDRDQLPSVETGDVLAALCDAGLPNRVHLEYSHRQGSDIDVAQLAGLVRDGDAAAALDGLRGERFRGVSWQAGSDRALAEAVLADALPAYRAVQAASDAAGALAAAKGFRVLTAVREGAAGSQTLNASIASALDPARRGDGFFHGRLVLVNENSYRHQLFNGDIGVCWPDEFGELRVWFDAPGGPRAWLPAALPAHESAFALTVHKSQGSEFDRVWLALPEHGARVLSRELLYTGLTRCRRQVTLWASELVLAESIDRQAQRWSGLAARLGAGSAGT